ncbi:MAG TPA: TIGR00730 family Rossman fold protein [Pirellulaceae bacterium]|nr:TIGR00730 family Rossman fold protein [Pirellulaceae bacterium]
MSSSDKKPSRSPDARQEPSESQTLRTADLIGSIKEYADKLLEDGSTRGDLKILSRTLRELRYAFKVFAPYRHRRKVTIFGSARTKPDAPAYQQTVKFGRAMAEHDWMVITGAGDGIMGAGHEGAGREHSMGLNIMLPFEQSANAVMLGDSKLVHMKYFFTRKLMFVKECDAVVCLPGGFGTIDEALEVLTLLQTGKHDMVPVVFLDAPGGTYWKALHEFICNHLLQGAMISEDDLHLYKVTDSCDETVEEILHFYRRYHSMRYAREELVLRLNKALSDEQLDAISAQFSGILTKGTFRQSSALRAERDEPELDDKPRLIFQFNRRDLGRLRQLIDILNSSMPPEA